MNKIQRRALEEIAARLIEQADEINRQARALLLAARVKDE